MDTEKKPKISVIMVDGSYRENFFAVDFFGNQTMSEDDYELLWVEYYDSVNPELAEKISKHPNFRVITLGKEGGYHSSYCFNRGIVESKGDLFIIPDADQACEEDFLETVFKEHQTNDKLVMYVHRRSESKKDHMPDVDIDHLRKVCVQGHPNNYGGCLTVRKKWLLEINGYDQYPIFGSGEHANGSDVYFRLRNLGLHVMWHPHLTLYHPWHPIDKHRYSHEIQRVVVNYRALTLATISFRGIDAAKDSEPSEDLVEKIEVERKKYSGMMRLVLEMRNSVGLIVSKMMKMIFSL